MAMHSSNNIFTNSGRDKKIHKHLAELNCYVSGINVWKLYFSYILLDEIEIDPELFPGHGFITILLGSE